MTVQSELRGVNDVTPHPQNCNTHPAPQVEGLQRYLDHAGHQPQLLSNGDGG